jgi:hypothetical protein
MAVSLMFGGGVATLFTMIVIPLGCISAEKRFKRGAVELMEEKLKAQETAAEGAN